MVGSPTLRIEAVASNARGARLGPSEVTSPAARKDTAGFVRSAQTTPPWTFDGPVGIASGQAAVLAG